MAKLYGYCRKSTEEQNETSFEVQESFIREHAPSGYQVEIITETASGSTIDGRPKFKSLLSRIRRGDIISVYDSSRISRNTEDALFIIRNINEKGASIMVAGKVIDPNSPIDTMLWSVQSSFDTYQRQIQNQKSRQGIEAKKANGDWVMTGELFGYSVCIIRGKTIVKVDEDSAKVIRYIYSEYLKGKSGYSISKSLENTIVPSQPNIVFSPNFIRRMIARPIYMGYYIIDTTAKKDKLSKAELKSKLVKSNLYQPIVDEETWWKAYDMRRGYKRAHGKQFVSRYSYFEGSTVIHCPCCGIGLLHSYKMDNRVHAQKDVYRFVTHRKGCKNKTYRSIDRPYFELMMRTSFLLTMNGGIEAGGFFSEKKDKINLGIEDNMSLLVSLEGMMAENKKKTDRIIDAIMDGLIDKDTVKDKLNELKEEKNRITKQIDDVNYNIRAFNEDLEDIIEEESVNIVDEFIHASSTKRRTMYKKFIKDGSFNGKELSLTYANGKEYVFTMWEKYAKNIQYMPFKVYFNGSNQYEGKLNINDSTISIYYAKNSTKPTLEGYNSSNDSLFEEYADKGLKEICDTVNSQLKECQENSVIDPYKG